MPTRRHYQLESYNIEEKNRVRKEFHINNSMWIPPELLTGAISERGWTVHLALFTAISQQNYNESKLFVFRGYSVICVYSMKECITWAFKVGGRTSEQPQHSPRKTGGWGLFLTNFPSNLGQINVPCIIPSEERNQQNFTGNVEITILEGG